MDWNEMLQWLANRGSIAAIIGTLAAFSLCFFLPVAALGLLFFKGWKNLKKKELDSQSWLSATGKIIKSRVEVLGGEYTSVSPKIIYEYRVGANEYTGNQIQVFGIDGNESAYDLVDRYPEGLEVTVYYNPDDPAESTLER